MFILKKIPAWNMSQSSRPVGGERKAGWEYEDEGLLNNMEWDHTQTDEFYGCCVEACFNFHLCLKQEQVIGKQTGLSERW